MDAGIADTLNRHVAQLVAARLDVNDELMADHLSGPWYRGPIGDSLMGDNDANDADRAWLIGTFAARTPGVDLDSIPADYDWENLFASFRAEITARRDPETPHVGLAETQPVEVV